MKYLTILWLTILAVQANPVARAGLLDGVPLVNNDLLGLGSLGQTVGTLGQNVGNLAQQIGKVIHNDNGHTQDGLITGVVQRPLGAHVLGDVLETGHSGLQQVDYQVREQVHKVTDGTLLKL